MASLPPEEAVDVGVGMGTGPRFSLKFVRQKAGMRDEMAGRQHGTGGLLVCFLFAL